MKTLAVLSALGFMCGLSQRQLAQAVNIDPMPWTAQLGVCGACLSIVVLVLVRTLPQMARYTKEGIKEASEINAKSIDGLRSEIGGMRADIREDQAATQGLLREALFRGEVGHERER